METSAPVCECGCHGSLVAGVEANCKCCEAAPLSGEGGERPPKQRDADLIVPSTPPPIGTKESTSEQAETLGNELWEQWFCRAMTSKETWMKHVMPILRKYFPPEAVAAQGQKDAPGPAEDVEDLNARITREIDGCSLPYEQVIGVLESQAAFMRKARMDEHGASPEELTLMRLLCEHWPTIECDHENKMDRAICSCSKINLDWQENVGEAVKSWAEHVLTLRVGGSPARSHNYHAEYVEAVENIERLEEKLAARSVEARPAAQINTTSIANQIGRLASYWMHPKSEALIKFKKDVAEIINSQQVPTVEPTGEIDAKHVHPMTLRECMEAEEPSGPGNPRQREIDSATKPLHLRIEELERENGWIRVEDDLPKNEIAKLIYVKESLCHFTAYWDGSDWLGFLPGNRTPLIEGVTHWKEIQNDTPGSLPSPAPPPDNESFTTKENAVKPSIGRIVIYNHPGSSDGKYPPQKSPAIIQNVAEDGSVRLFVFGPKGQHMDEGLIQGDGPCQWNWPERV